MTILALREKLLGKGLKVFGYREMGILLGKNHRMTKYYLEKYEREGLVLRLKPGMYCLKTDMLSEGEIANQVYQPSYVSFEYALAYYNILPEMVYTITSATTKPSRRFEILEKAYEYTTIKKELYWGYDLNTEGESKFLLASPEKALLDFWYLVTLGKRVGNDRLDLSRIDKEKLLDFARKYNRPGLSKMVYAFI